jgi:hypothetical protein
MTTGRWHAELENTSGTDVRREWDNSRAEWCDCSTMVWLLTGVGLLGALYFPPPSSAPSAAMAIAVSESYVVPWYYL